MLRISEKIDRERKKKNPINWSFVFIFTRAAVGVAGQIDHKRQNVMDSGRLFSLGTCTSQPVDALRANDCDDRFCMEIILIFIDEEDSSIFRTYLLSSPVHWMHHCFSHCSIALSFFYHIFFSFILHVPFIDVSDSGWFSLLLPIPRAFDACTNIIQLNAMQR